MATVDELLDALMKDCKKPEDVVGENGLLKQLTKRVLERAMQTEMTDHLGYEKHSTDGNNSGNSRNGTYKKTVKGEFGALEVTVPRDRNGTFEPLILPKGQSRFTGFDDKIISMYAHGMTTRDIQSHLQEMYGIEISPTLVSQVTDAIADEVKQWQNRLLDEIYPIVYLDAIRVKVRHNGRVTNKAVYLAIGVNMEGIKEVLGMWTAENEGAKFWLHVVTELRNRGVKDIFIACVDGLKGFPEAIEAVFPETQIQLCIVHMVRHSLNYVVQRDRQAAADDLKTIYQAPTVQQAETNLTAFEAKWDNTYPSVSKIWRRNWDNIIPFFSYAPEIRKVIYTTNAIESLNMSVRKATRNRSSFPNDDAMYKLLFLAFKQVTKVWTRPNRTWKLALNQFSIIYEGRMPVI